MFNLYIYVSNKKIGEKKDCIKCMQIRQALERTLYLLVGEVWVPIQNQLIPTTFSHKAKWKN